MRRAHEDEGGGLPAVPDIGRACGFLDFRSFFSISETYFLVCWRAVMINRGIPAHRGRLQEDWPEARSRERRPRARANSLCTRAATGSSAGHYDPARCLGPMSNGRGSPMGRQDAAVKRREASAPASLVRGTPRKVFLACRVMARARCGDPHQRLSALHSLMPSVMEMREGGTQSPARNGRKHGEAAAGKGRSVGCLTT